MPRTQLYTIDDLFVGDAPEAFGALGFDDTPAFANSFQDGPGSSLGAGEFIGNTIMQDGYLKSSNFISGTSGWYLGPDGTIEAVNGTFSGAITAASGAIGGFTVGADYLRDAADSFGLASTVSGSDDVRFWAGNTFANRATAAFRVTEAGAVTASSMTITGGAITSTPIASIPNNSSTDISLLEKTHTMVFSVTDLNTIAWGSGTVTLSNGRTFSISAGNTGNMAALTYIYLDPGVSLTVLQTTTTAATAMGANKILIGTAQNNTVTASYIPYGPGQPLIDGANIGALSIVAGNIAASTITATKLTVSQLSAIAADLGTITAGTVTGATLRTSSSNPKFNMTSTSFQGINSAGTIVFEIIISGGNSGDVIMGDDATSRYAMWDDSASTFSVNGYVATSKGSFGGDGTDGALSISSGTTTLSAASAALLQRNYTSISITSTAALTISNKHTAGTLLLLKSQGNVTITSSATAAIDMLGMGANGGTATNNGTQANFIVDDVAHYGDAGEQTGGGDAHGFQLTNRAFYSTSAADLHRRYYAIPVGSGGGASATEAGGAGGGSVVIECNGALNFSGTIRTSGAAGAGGTKGAGGGGAAGHCLILYNTLTANSGTLTSAGGAGGTATGSGDGLQYAGGEGAGSYGGDGGVGGGPGADVGVAGGTGAGGGGGGAISVSGASGGAGGSSMGGYVLANTIFP